MVNENAPSQRTVEIYPICLKGNTKKDAILLIQNLLQYIMSSSVNHFGQNYTF